MSDPLCTVSLTQRALPRSPCRPLSLAALGLLALLTGCAGWSYDRVQMGMTQQECERLLAEDVFHRTDLGYCYLKEEPGGDTDAVVILLARDGLVAGKIEATGRGRGWLRRDLGFSLHGELDPSRSALDATGPIDALRAITNDLVSYRGARPALRAHAWIAAGLVRLMERWPHVGQTAGAYPELTDTLDQVPGGGVTNISVDPRGVYSFEYHQTAPP